MTGPIHWREPLWLLLTLAPLLLMLWARWRSQRMAHRYADPDLWTWALAQHREQARRRTGRMAAWTGMGAIPARNLVLTLGWALACAALAGPRLAANPVGPDRAAAGSIIVILDLSRSMAARDGATRRRERALGLVRAWNSDPRAPAIGLVAFAGRAHTVFPPSTDSDAVAHILEQLSSVELPTLGNDLAGALHEADKLARNKAKAETGGTPDNTRFVLLSDGDMEEAALARASAQLADTPDRAGSLLIIGMGSATAAPVPDPDTGWLRRDGRPVLSSLRDQALAQLAADHGARYLREAPSLGEPEALARLDLGLAPPGRAERDDADAWRPLFGLFLPPALLLLTAGLMMGPRVRRDAQGTHGDDRPFTQFALTGACLLVGLLVGLLTAPGDARAATEETRAFNALQGNTPKRARELYRQVPGARGRFGEAVACYRMDDLACAAEGFAAAAWLAGTNSERARAAYNLGTVQFRLGDFAASAASFADAQRLFAASGRGKDAQVPRIPTQELSDLEARLELSRTLAARVERHRAQAQRALSRAREALAGEAPEREALIRDLDLPPPPPGALPEALSAERFDLLTRRGLIRRLDGKPISEGPSRWFGGQDSAASQSAARIWERVFEIAEGFPAPQDKARERPGQRPW
ncbi:MAG: vWA domain-containing protein [Gammaproteobacteria bacterium]